MRIKSRNVEEKKISRQAEREVNLAHKMYSSTSRHRLCNTLLCAMIVRSPGCAYDSREYMSY